MPYDLHPSSQARTRLCECCRRASSTALAWIPRKHFTRVTGQPVPPKRKGDDPPARVAVAFCSQDCADAFEIHATLIP